MLQNKDVTKGAETKVLDTLEQKTGLDQGAFSSKEAFKAGLSQKYKEEKENLQEKGLAYAEQKTGISKDVLTDPKAMKAEMAKKFEEKKEEGWKLMEQHTGLSREVLNDPNVEHEIKNEIDAQKK